MIPKSLRILHISGEVEDAGGVLSVLRNLQQPFAERGWRQSVWVNEQLEQRRQPLLDLHRGKNIYPEPGSKLHLLAQTVKAAWELKALLRREHFDVVHAHTRGTFMVSALLTTVSRRHIVFSNHNYASRKGMYRKMANLPRLHTVVLTPNMGRYYGLQGNPRVQLAPDCCADSLFAEPLKVQPFIASEKRKLHLVGMGSILKWKGWHLLIEAIAQLPAGLKERVQVTIWGPVMQLAESRSYYQELRRAIAHYGLDDQIQLPGRTTTVVQELQKAHWFVLPSTNEPCSVALLEAQALGIPALVSASGGNVDIVRPGANGLLFQPEDAGSLAAQLTRILQDNPFTDTAANIRNSTVPYSARKVAEQYALIYARCLPCATAECCGRIKPATK